MEKFIFFCLLVGAFFAISLPNAEVEARDGSDIGMCMGECASEQGICIGQCNGNPQCINYCAEAHGRCVASCTR